MKKISENEFNIILYKDDTYNFKPLDILVGEIIEFPSRSK